LTIHPAGLKMEAPVARWAGTPRFPHQRGFMHPRLRTSYSLLSVIVFCFAANIHSQSPPPVSFQAAVDYPVGLIPAAGTWTHFADRSTPLQMAGGSVGW
jgi:hypothetical protein